MIYSDLVLMPPNDDTKSINYNCEWYAQIINDTHKDDYVRWYIMRMPNKGICQIVHEEYKNLPTKTFTWIYNIKYQNNDMYDLLHSVELDHQCEVNLNVKYYQHRVIDFIINVYFHKPTWGETFRRWGYNVEIFVKGIMMLSQINL